MESPRPSPIREVDESVAVNEEDVRFLQAIVGEDVGLRSSLTFRLELCRSFLIGADGDINRAVNHYLSALELNGIPGDSKAQSVSETPEVKKPAQEMGPPPKLQKRGREGGAPAKKHKTTDPDPSPNPVSVPNPLADLKHKPTLKDNHKSKGEFPPPRPGTPELPKANAEEEVEVVARVEDLSVPDKHSAPVRDPPRPQLRRAGSSSLFAQAQPIDMTGTVDVSVLLQKVAPPLDLRPLPYKANSLLGTFTITLNSKPNPHEKLVRQLHKLSPHHLLNRSLVVAIKNGLVGVSCEGKRLEVKVPCPPAKIPEAVSQSMGEILIYMLQHDCLKIGSLSNKKPLNLSPVKYKPAKGADPWSLFEVFEAIRPPPDAPELADPPGLACRLRHFQRQAVYWMVERETATWAKPVLHPCFVHIASQDKTSNLFLDLGSRTYSTKIVYTPGTRPGGLLCEEMGLGKTVEVIALILAHQRDPKTFTSNWAQLNKWNVLQEPVADNSDRDKSPERGRGTRLKRLAPQAKMVDENSEQAKFEKEFGQPLPVDISTTLIIAPESILHQWVSELAVHGKNLKVFYYNGMGHGAVDPRVFAKYDVVVTTYGVLQTDVKKHSRRNPTPLICVQWWRVIVDEAQMVSNSNSNTAHMASCIFAVNRWCVTGTPVANSLSDLFGLLEFLYHDPMSNDKNWNHTLLVPWTQRQPEGLERMRVFLRQIMWRHTKGNAKRF